MAALVFTLALFLYWTAIGAAVLAAAPARLNPRQSVMLAPAIGAAAATLPIFWLNQVGHPVRSYALPVLVLLALGAAAILWWRRPVLELRRMGPFFAILVLALLLSGWPMLRYGFDWASYNNMDMTHYSLGALRVLNGGFFDAPSLDDVVRGTDHSVHDAYKYILYNARSGAERTLAALWTATGLNPHLIFMPVVLALHLALVCAAASMVAGGAPETRAPLLLALLMAVSPLTTLGAMYQVIAQVAGLAFLCASITLLCRVLPSGSLAAMARDNVALVIVMAGFFIWYPEILPFLGLGWFAYLAMVAWRDRRAAACVVGLALVAGAMLMLVLNTYFMDAILFMLSQAAQGANPAAVAGSAITESPFPYFLLPTGLANLWGLLPIAGPSFFSEEPRLSFVIAAGFVLTLWLAWGLRDEARRASPAAAVLVVMAVLAAVLFHRGRDFGLFKLAMYMQPFLLAVAATRLAPMNPVRRPGILACVIAWILMAVASQFAYVSLSTGEYLAGLSEVWRGSSRRITSEFEGAVKRMKELSPAGMMSDTSSIVHLQHQTLHTKGYSAAFPAMGSWSNNEAQMYPQVTGMLPENRTLTLGGLRMTVVLPKRLRETLDTRALVTIPRYDSIFNTAAAGNAPESYYRVYAPGAARDHLVFMPTDKSAHYYGYSWNVPVVVNHLENDPLFPGRQFSGLGRYFLFMVVNPSPRPRLVVELTSTVMKHFESALPKPFIGGPSRQPMGFVGRGSGRVVSAPVEFATVEGVPFFALDMGRDARPTPFSKSRLMTLFGTSVNPDERRLTVYARDISLISDEAYRAMSPPAELASFPRDLGNRNLEYSGIYEDGYVSEESFFILKATSRNARVRISGMVPGIEDMAFKTRIHVLVDGVEVATSELGLGDFTVEGTVPGDATGKRRIEIRFDKAQLLPGLDARLTGGKISSIALVAQPE